MRYEQRQFARLASHIFEDRMDELSLLVSVIKCRTDEARTLKHFYHIDLHVLTGSANILQ